MGGCTSTQHKIHIENTNTNTKSVIDDDNIDIDDTTGLFYGINVPTDPTQCDITVDHVFTAYIQRQQLFHHKLQLLYDKTAKLQRMNLPSGITYVRPFLSSTFKDFNTERNICFATNFPRLEKLCAHRGIFFAPLDLRWGVTSEQSGSGQVIKLCLEEIDRSRPYFVCSLGFRNGWSLYPTDDTNDQYVQLLLKTFDIGVQQFPWIQQCMDRSVTELEILHGTLNNPQLNPRTYFYFRSCEFLNSIQNTERKIYVETGLAEIALMKLKMRIVQAGYKIQYFSSAMQMCDQLEGDMSGDIEIDFPIQTLTPLQRELKDHQAYSDIRSRIYVGGESYYSALDKYMLGVDSKPLVITGSAGSGKSSLLCNWLKYVRIKQESNSYDGIKRAVNTSTISAPKQLRSYASASGPQQHSSTSNSSSVVKLDWNIGLIQSWHIGSSSDSTVPGLLLRWSTCHIASEYNDIDLTIPQNIKQVINEYSDWIETAASYAPILLVIDGLDQLNSEDAQQLQWLPTQWPKNVRVILSCTNDSIAYKQLCELKYNIISCDTLSDDTCLLLTRTFLNSYGKALDAQQYSLIMSCERTRNPLYLMTFLQEVRVFGSFENLNKRITHYLQANNVSEMFSKVIERLEDDFESATPSLVQYTLLMLMCSRKGLAEPELKGCLEIVLNQCNITQSTDSTSTQLNPSFPNLEFSALMLRLDQQLVEQSGLRKFSHNYLRQAVYDKYINTVQPITDNNVNTTDINSTVYNTLITYFRSTQTSQRKAEELPWHLYTLIQSLYTQSNHTVNDIITQHIEQLISCISDLSMFALLNSSYQLDLHKYWSLIESITNNKDIVTQKYTQQLQLLFRSSGNDKNSSSNKLQYAATTEDVGTFLTSTDRYFGAELFFDQSIEIYNAIDSQSLDTERLLNKKANLLYRLGRFDSALPLYQRALAIAEHHSKTDSTSNIRVSVLMTSIAGLLKEQGKYTESKPLYEKSLADKILLLGNKHPVVAISMSNLADLYLRMYEPELALPLYRDALKIMELEHGRNHPLVATIVSALASCYLQQKQYSDAIQLYERARRIKEEMLGKYHISVAVVLNNLAAAYHSQGDTQQSIKLYERSLQIRRTQLSSATRDQTQTASTIINLALVYVADTKYTVALSYFSQALTLIETQHGSKSTELIYTLRNVGTVYIVLKQYRDALTTYNRILNIQESANLVKANTVDVLQLIQTYNQIGMCYQSMNDFVNALQWHKRELWSSQSKYGMTDIHVSDVYMVLGVVMVSLNDEVNAILCFRRCYAIRLLVHDHDSEQCMEARGWVDDLECNDEDEENDDGTSTHNINWSCTVSEIDDPCPPPVPSVQQNRSINISTNHHRNDSNNKTVVVAVNHMHQNISHSSAPITIQKPMIQISTSKLPPIILKKSIVTT